MKCKICSHFTTIFDTATVLDKYEVTYYQCDQCGFIQTEDPYWLEEAYSDAIDKSDIGLISRNLALEVQTRTIITLFFNQKEQFLDYGGGYGLFVRLMRDKGFDFYLYDPNCENIFAKNFEIEYPSDKNFHLLTAFEVFEHFVDPLSEIDKLLSLSPNIIFSTLLIPKHNPRPQEWWYYGLEGGQHVSLFSRESLNYLANKIGLRIYSNGSNYHLLTKKTISPVLYSLVTKIKISKVINQFIRQPSLLQSDYLKAVGHPLD
jgi:2-polyprenyl-3-methyl-5-hydroxy-6-metoxy-1,4-benzoquinol methylase